MNEENLIIHKIFSSTVSKSPDKVALQIKKDNQWRIFTYRESEGLSQKVAAFLIKEGLKKADFVALILENRPEWPIIYLGLMYAGLTCVPLDPQLTQTELKNLIIDSSAKVIFCSYDIFTKKISQDIQAQLTKIIVLDAPDSKEQNFINFSHIEGVLPDKINFPVVMPEDVASLIYTSGTTAKAKGVLLTHKNICSNFRSIEKSNICLSSDNMLSILPLYHTYAFMVNLIVPLFLGGTVTHSPPNFKPQELSSIIKEANVTVLVGVPQLFSLLHKAIFDKLNEIPAFLLPFIIPFIRRRLHCRLGRSLRLMVSGGASLQPKIGCDFFRLGFKLIEGYGLTETSPVVTLNPPEKIKFGSVGKPIPDVQITILDPDKSGMGEVLIKGPNVMLGYFKQPEITAQVIKDSWFYSGDLGYIDKDGYLFLSGRKKDVIVLSSGKNIYPDELQDYYRKSPYIKEICILPKKEERFGRLTESLYAVVVPDLEYFHQTKVKDILGKIRWELENLAKDAPSYKHIMGFTLTKEELPHTALKKIKRYEVEQKYLEGGIPESGIKEGIYLEEDFKILNKDITQKIINYISVQLNKPVYLDSHLEIDLGIDSLSRVELGLGIESLLSLKIPDEVLYNVSTVKEVIIKILEIIDKAQPAIEESKKAQKTWNQILSEQPQEITFKGIRTESSFLDKLFIWLFKNIFLFIFRVCWLLRIEARGHLSQEGPYLICPNHASFLDGLVVFSSLPLKCLMNTFFLGYSAILEHPLLSWAIKSARIIPIDPDTNLTEAMQKISFILKHNKIICIFPEGKRSIDGSIQEFKKGVGILIKELNVPAIPVYIKGSHQSWPRGSLLPRLHPLKIIFGQPFLWKESMKKEAGTAPIDEYEAISQGLREKLIKLSLPSTGL